MKRILPSILFVVLTGITNASEPLPIIGNWVGDVTEMILSQPNQPEGMKEALEKMPDEQKPKIFLTYSKDGTFTSLLKMFRREQNFSGNWEIIERSEKIIKIKTVGSQKKNEAVVTFELAADDTMIMTNPSMPGKVTVKRAKE